MNKFALRVVWTVTTLAPALLAHGGQYRGPSSVVPPSNSTGSSGNAYRGAGDVSPSKPTATAPTTTAPGSSSANTGTVGAAATSRAPKGMPLDDDLGRWEYWWEFGKDPFLRLRDAVYAGSRSPEDDLVNARRFASRRAVDRPRDADLDAVTQALRDCLDRTTNRDLVSGCLVALAKLGREPGTWNFVSSAAPLLRSGDQELRETAALALGIAGNASPEVVELLADLVRDNASARRRSGDTAVNERTRAFAAYGIGLLLPRAPTPAVQQVLLEPLLEIVRNGGAAFGRDLQVAAIEAMAQMPRTDAPATKLLRARVIEALGAYYLRDAGAGDRLLQAHVPPAVARLLAPGDAQAAYWKDLFVADLRAGIDTQGSSTQGRGGNLFIAQSCALALGAIAAPWNADKEGDGNIGTTLLQAYREHRDQQTRSFALLAIARMGGDRAREVLLRELENSGKAIEQPWCAMALGVLTARTADRNAAAGGAADADTEVHAALRKALAAAHNPSAVAALAVAIGLSGDPEAGDRLRAALNENQKKDDVAGYTALALGLLRDQHAVNDVRALAQSAARRPFVLMQCTRALGLLGDASASELLCAQIESPDAGIVRLAAASAALGQLGDRRSIEPLLRMLANEKLSELSRAFAAVALGILCDKDALPWNTVYATSTNYRAATDTLTDGQKGILDIL